MGWQSGESMGGSALFKEENSELHNTGLWKCIMAPTKAISEDLRSRVVDAQQAGNSYINICKESGLHQVNCQAGRVEMEAILHHCDQQRSHQEQGV